MHKHLAVPSINTVHAAQVKDVSGRWIDVVLQEREVAFFLGATAARATGGLLKAAVTRVVCTGQASGCSCTWQPLLVPCTCLWLCHADAYRYAAACVFVASPALQHMARVVEHIQLHGVKVRLACIFRLSAPYQYKYMVWNIVRSMAHSMVCGIIHNPCTAAPTLQACGAAQTLRLCD